MSDIEREKFEKAYDSGEIYIISRNSSVIFGDIYKHEAWAAWQSARQAPTSGEPVAWVSSALYGSKLTFQKPEPPEGWEDYADDWYCRPLYTHPPAKAPEGDRDKVVWGVYDHLCEKFDFNLDPVLDIVGYLVDEGLINTTPTLATTPETERAACGDTGFRTSSDVLIGMWPCEHCKRPTPPTAQEGE